MYDYDELTRVGTETKKRILIVDGADDARVGLGLSLRREGFLVSSAKSGTEALDIIEDGGLPDLIIVEIMMPRMDAFSLADEIRRQSNVPIVVVSATTDLETKVESLHEFAEDYLTKPADIGELSARIRRILGHYQEGQVEISDTSIPYHFGCRPQQENRTRHKRASLTMHRNPVHRHAYSVSRSLRTE